MEFISLGTVQMIDGRKRIVPNSMGHHIAGMARFPVGAKVRATYKEVKGKHTQAQHNYHYALCEYIGDHTGYTKDETHDAMMKHAFGSRKVTILGRTTEARESLSDSARLPVGRMVELINKDLEVCAQLGIVVPTAQELGYLPN